jgi:hypothetical protein
MPHTVVAMYDVDNAVGRFAPNLSIDVMLVQFFLSTMALNPVWNTMSYFSNDFVLPSGPAPIFPINGVFQPALADWIASFQTQATRSSAFGPLIVDGRVDPANTGWFRPHHPPHRRTIQVMNHILLIADRSRFERLDSDPWMPGALQTALRTFRYDL